MTPAEQARADVEAWLVAEVDQGRLLDFDGDLDVLISRLTPVYERKQARDYAATALQSQEVAHYVERAERAEAERDEARVLVATLVLNPEAQGETIGKLKAAAKGIVEGKRAAEADVARLRECLAGWHRTSTGHRLITATGHCCATAQLLAETEPQ